MHSFLQLWLLTRITDSPTFNNRYTNMAASLMPLDINPGCSIQEFLNAMQQHVNQYDLHNAKIRFRKDGKEVYFLFAVDIDEAFDLVFGDEPLEQEENSVLNYETMVEDTEDEGLFSCGC